MYKCDLKLFFCWGKNVRFNLAINSGCVLHFLPFVWRLKVKDCNFPPKFSNKKRLNWIYFIWTFLFKVTKTLKARYYIYIFLNMTFLPTQDFIKRILGVWRTKVKSLVWSLFQDSGIFYRLGGLFFKEKKGSLSITYDHCLHSHGQGSKKW